MISRSGILSIVNVTVVNVTFLVKPHGLLLQNRIRSVSPGTFSGLQHLRVLYLDDNDLAEVNLTISICETSCHNKPYWISANPTRNTQQNQTNQNQTKTRPLSIQVPTPALAPLPHLAELSLALNNIKVNLKSWNNASFNFEILNWLKIWSRFWRTCLKKDQLTFSMISWSWDWLIDASHHKK